MTDPRIRQLVIKSGVVRRLTREKYCYAKEVVTEQARLEKLRGDGADDHVLRKQEEVIQECIMMVPDSKRRYAFFRFPLQKPNGTFLSQTAEGVRGTGKVPRR